MSIVDEIKNRLDLVEIVEGYGVQLRKAGRNYSGFCPFHHNTRTPAFSVSPEHQYWHCYGACAEGGDIFSFVMKQERIDFSEALKLLAARAGVELPAYRPQADAARSSRHERLATLLETAADYFHHLLLEAPEGEAARQYVRSRNLLRRSVETFKLGYALGGWDNCRTHFEMLGYTVEEMLAAGLLSLNEERGTTYDRFRNRLIFPIWDDQARVVGFGARTLLKDETPKYLNSPQSELFNKGNLLYGLNFARRDIRDARQAVIVEGYMDVIRAHEAGYKNVVAQMGTALTETQLRLLTRSTHNLVIALDADEAGLNATMRSLDVARETLERDYEVTGFDARGLVRSEGHLKADIRIVTLPAGQDPDDIIRSDPAQWAQLVQRARPVVQYVIETLTAELDLNDARQKSDIAQRIIPLIHDVGDAIERDHYWQTLARRLQVDERALRRIVPETPRRARAARGGDAPGPRAASRAALVLEQRMIAPRDIALLEQSFLREVAHYPTVMVQVDNLLRRHHQPLVGRDDFSATEDRLIWQALRRHAAGSDRALVPLSQMWDSLDDVLKPRAEMLLAMPPSAAERRDQLPVHLVRNVLTWRSGRIRQELAELRALLKQAQADSDDEASDAYNTRCNQLTLMTQSIHRVQRQLTILGQRMS